MVVVIVVVPPQYMSKVGYEYPICRRDVYEREVKSSKQKPSTHTDNPI